MRLYRPLTAPPRAPSAALACLLAALLMLAAVSIHTLRFADRNYREDEVNTIHAANTKSIPAIVRWTTESGVHPAAWLILAPAWEKAFGQHEPVTRYLATLMTLLALALIYRLGADLFDRQVGLIALLLTAAIPFFQFHAHEFRPYSWLTTLSAGATLAFIRWLRQPEFKYALLYVIFGVLAVQTHYYAVYVILAHAITLLIVVRWERGLYLRAFGLFAAIGISFLPWIIAILHTALLRPDRGIVTKGGLSYALPSDFEGLFILVQNLQGLPLLVLTALIIPVGAIYPYLKYDRPARDDVFRFGQEWRRWVLIVLSLSILALAFVANTQIRNLTPRNMIVLLPGVVVLTAFQIRAMGPGIRRWLIVLLALVGLLVFHAYNVEIPYQETRDFITEDYTGDTLIVTNINHHGAATLAMSYYLWDWLPDHPAKTRFFHIVEPDIDPLTTWPHDPIPQIVQDATPALLAEFEAFLSATDQVYLIGFYGPPLYDDLPVSEAYLALLQQDFVPVRTATFDTPFEDSDDPDADHYVVTEFERQ